MRLTTNFTRPTGRLAPYLAGVSLLLSVVLLTLIIVLWVAADQMRSDQPEWEAKLSTLQSREVTKPVAIIPQSQLIALREHVQQLNTLTGAAGTSLPQLLPRLEKLLPDTVWLLSLQHRARDGETRLLVESAQADHLTDFMEALEKSHTFAQVLLTRKVERNEGAQHTVQFEILLRESP